MLGAASAIVNRDSRPVQTRVDVDTSPSQEWGMELANGSKRLVEERGRGPAAIR